MHYYQHHIGDFIQATARLSDSQSMTYLRMLWLYYETEQPLPNNTKVIGLKVGADPDAVALILEVFFQPDGDVWRHKRCDAEIADYKAIRDRNRQNGKAGGRPKKTQWVSSGMPVETDTKPHGNPNQEPITIKKEKIDKKEKPARAARASIMPADFYPDEVGCRYAEERKISLAVELERFRNHHTAKGSRFTSWQAAWRTWCDKAVQFGASPAAPRKTQHQINAEATARALGYGQTNGSFFDVIGECHEVKTDVATRLGGPDFR